MVLTEPTIMYAQPVIDKMFENFKPNFKAHLYIFSNESDPASKIYVRNKQKKCQEFGIKCTVYDISEWNYMQLRDTLFGIENDIIYDNYIIVQKPLPNQLKECEEIIDNWLSRNPALDLDAFDGDLKTDFSTPATPLGIMKMLDYYVGLDKLEGMNAVVIGRSKIVGKPMAELLNKKNCTVTLCHSKTKDISFYTKNADIIIVAVGKPKFLTKEMLGENKPIIVDIGINRDENGKVCGDVDFENVKDKCSFISPVPKGVGPLTVASLVYKMGEVV